MADNDLKIWQNHLLPNPFHMVDAKFDLVLRPISHGNPAMPFVNNLKITKEFLRKNKDSMYTNADKGNISVLMRRSEYIREME